MSLRQRILSPRQHEIIECLHLGLSNKEIAYRLGIAEGTVKIHLHSALNKTGLRNRTQLALMKNWEKLNVEMDRR